MKIYIRATAAISPQKTFECSAFPPDLTEYIGNRLKCIEPDYNGLIEARFIRRMSRIVRMGVAAARQCLDRANERVPGAIVTGTAYGCLEDTEFFLREAIREKGEIASPGAFIQSTHNTIGAQIALLVQCTGYNNTIVHRGFSFETALLDAKMLLLESETQSVLTGSADELTDLSFAILKRFGFYKRLPGSNFGLFASASKGTIAGEGAAFFLLTTLASENNYAILEATATFYKPASIGETQQAILAFLAVHRVNPEDIDLVITGRNGERTSDEIYDWLEQSIFGGNKSMGYKNLCGEYPTSASFALWLAADIFRMGRIPAALGYEGANKDKIKRILIYNHYLTIHHSLFLVSAC